jgi:[ribosomal protein S5]-alanine N-acetyltransferase
VGHREFDNEELLTARLSLRRPTPADIDVIYAIHRDSRACAHNPADMLTTRADAEDLYRRWDEHWQRHGFGYWVIRARRVRKPLGFCGIKVMQLKDHEVLNLFYRLDPSAWGNGIATEAAIGVVGWATAHDPDCPVIARIRPDNAASLRVAAGAGLHRAEHLDSQGEDGLDWIFISHWP